MARFAERGDETQSFPQRAPAKMSDCYCHFGPRRIVAHPVCAMRRHPRLRYGDTHAVSRRRQSLFGIRQISVRALDANNRSKSPMEKKAGMKAKLVPNRKDEGYRDDDQDNLDKCATPTGTCLTGISAPICPGPAIPPNPNC